MIHVILGERFSSSGVKLALLLGDVEQEGLVNWTGGRVPDSLNQHSYTNKLRQLTELSQAGIPTPTFSTTPGTDGEWLARRNFHQQGFDFTNRRLQRGHLPADYFVKKEDIVDEWRVHVFRTKKDNMRILRVAKRVPARVDHHPWVRSHRLGWRLSYVGGASEPYIQAARAALRALHLDFGAVDLGVRPDSSPCVLEVNTCPGIEGNTLIKYAEAIKERLS
jgi:hypothetical protein